MKYNNRTGFLYISLLVTVGLTSCGSPDFKVAQSSDLFHSSSHNWVTSSEDLEEVTAENLLANLPEKTEIELLSSIIIPARTKFLYFYNGRQMIEPEFRAANVNGELDYAGSYGGKVAVNYCFIGFKESATFERALREGSIYKPTRIENDEKYYCYGAEDYWEDSRRCGYERWRLHVMGSALMGGGTQIEGVGCYGHPEIASGYSTVEQFQRHLAGRMELRIPDPIIIDP